LKFLIKVIVTCFFTYCGALTLLFKACELHSPLPTLDWASSILKPWEIQPSPPTPRYLRHDVLPDRATPPPEDDNTSINSGQGSGLLPDILDGLDPFSIGSFNYALEKWPETFSMPPKLESFEDPIRNTDTNVIVNVLSDVSNVVDHPAKRQKIATPTVSPTSVCQSKTYLSHRDPSVLDIVNSIPMAYSRNTAYTELYQDAADDMRAIVANHSPPYMYNPESDAVSIGVMRSVCNDLNQCNNPSDWRNLKTTEHTVIYAHVDNASNEVRYVGYTSNYKERHEFHLAKKEPLYFLDHTSVRLVSYDNIPSSVDGPLSDRLIRLWTDITQLANLPPNLTRLYTKVLDSWYRGGPKKQYSAQTLEIGEQRHYDIPTIMAEAFMFDEVKETRLTGYATQTGEALVAVIDNAWGKEISIAPEEPFGISTWPTGAKAGTLSSCIEATEYMLGNDNWKNTFPHPIFPNAETEAKIFTAPSSPEHIALGQSNFRESLRPYAQNSKKYSITLADAQAWIWKSLVRPQMVLCELGFEHVDTLLGGEIIAFRKDNALVFLHGHLSIVCDSREEIAIVDRQRRAVSVDALRIARQRAVGDNSPKRFDAIVGSIYAEISDVGWHGSRRFGAAICRDTMSSKDAIAAFGGPTQTGLTPANDINYPTSNSARYRADGEQWTMQRFTDEISQRGIEAAVRSYHSYMEANNLRLGHQRRRWREVIEWYRGHSALKEQVKDAARTLPSGGDIAPQRASMDVNHQLRSAIVEYNRQGKPLADYRVFFVKKGKTFAAQDFAGLNVYNIFTATNSKNTMSVILRKIANSKDVNTLISGFKAVTRSEGSAFLGGLEIPKSLAMYKLQL